MEEIREVVGVMFHDSTLLRGIAYFLWMAFWFPVYFIGDIIMLQELMFKDNYYPMIIATETGTRKVQYVHLLAGCILEWTAIYAFFLSKFRIKVYRYEKRNSDKDDILDS